MNMRAALGLFLLIAARANSQVWIDSGGGDWKPDDSVLEDATSKLSESFSSAADERSGVVPPWTGYQLRYQGYVENGVRLLKISGSCTKGEETCPEHEEIVVTADGGPCYFDAIYETKERLVVYFFLHGYA